MNTPSNINLIITQSLCYTQGDWFCQDDMVEETGKGKDVLAGELRQMAGYKAIIMYTTNKNATWYKRPNPEAEKIARGPWRSKTNDEIGCIAHDCWAVI